MFSERDYELFLFLRLLFEGGEHLLEHYGVSISVDRRYVRCLSGLSLSFISPSTRVCWSSVAMFDRASAAES